MHNTNTVSTLGNVSTFGRQVEEFGKMFKKSYWVHSEGKDYGAAVAQCRAEGGKLAEPKSAQENGALVALARTISFPPFPANWHAVWMGIRRWSGSIRYESNGQPIGYANWFFDGEPNNILGVENCVGLYQVFLFMWADIVCSYHNSFICERGKYSQNHTIIFRSGSSTSKLWLIVKKYQIYTIED